MKVEINMIARIIAIVLFGSLLPVRTAAATVPAQPNAASGTAARPEPLLVIASCAPDDEFIKLAAQTYARNHPSVRLRVSRMPLPEAAEKLVHGQVDLMLTAAAIPARPQHCILELHKNYLAAVNPINVLENISLARLKKIAMGTITNWEELGGPSLPVKYLGYRNQAAEGRVLAILLHGTPNPEKMFLATTSGREIAAIIATESGAIGIFPQEYRTDGIKVLKVNGVPPPSPLNADSEYPLTVRYYVAATARPSAPAQDFIAFLHRDEAAKIYHYLSLNRPNHQPDQSNESK
ncbi:MAG: substrate-binding domain-containing protein [Victivallales bacterium]|nr:substrate-binding domain-containing protein [Victivallales bacterium]